MTEATVVANRIQREEFIRQLEAVQPGISQRGVLEQSESFVFRKGRVLTFNGEVACKGKSCLPVEFTGAIKADKILDLLRKLPEDELDVQFSDAELILSGKRRQLGLRVEKEIALPVHMVEKPGEWKKLHDDFGEAIGIVGACASTDQSQFEYTCIHIHPKWIESTDRKQICRWNLDTGVEKPVLCKQSSIKHVKMLGMTEFCETKAWIHFKNANGLQLSCLRYMEDFPDLATFLKVNGEPAIFPKQLSEAADKAQVFSSENGEGNLITIDLKPGKLKIRGEGVSGWYSETKKVKYDGKPLLFMVSPVILGELVKSHSQVFIAPGALKVDGGAFAIVICLLRPQKQEENGRTDE